MSLRVAGLDALRRRLASLPDAARTALAPALGEVASGVADDVRAALDGEDGAGPSAPGGPPRDPAGRLADSVAVTEGTERADAAMVAVAVAAPYASFLEYGTARMAARPFLRPAARRGVAGARALLTTALRRGLSP